MEKQIEHFLNFIQNEKKLSDNTFQSYKRDILQYQNYININSLDYSKASEENIKDYLSYLADLNKKATTISRHLASIRLFYQYCTISSSGNRCRACRGSGREWFYGICL